MHITKEELFSSIRRIQILTTHLAEDILAGAYHSAFKGRGIEFEEVREYEPGDEIRSIDWNVTARMDRPYVKNFREERELTILLMIDVSYSSRFGSTKQLKNEFIAELGALLAFSAIKNNDKVGLLLFSEEVEKYIPPKKGLRHVLRLIREILYFQPKHKGTNIASALSFLGQVHRRKSVCFLLSDFLCGVFDHELSLMAKKHDLIGMNLIDPYEERFPSIGLVHLEDLETTEQLFVDTSFRPGKTQFEEGVEKRHDHLKNLFAKVGASLIEIRTDQSYLVALKKFFKIRGKKIR
jgi:uncharacterized protein (DUF58 family)